MLPALAEVAKTAPDPWRPEDLEKLPGQSAHPCFVVLQNGIPVGFACFLAVCETADLQLVVLAPPCRGQGFGQKLLQHTFAALYAGGVRRVLLELRCGNAPALALYQKLGFAILCKKTGLYKNPAEDGYLMARELLKTHILAEASSLPG